MKGELTTLEKKVCVLCMISEADFLEQKRADEAQARERKGSKIATMQEATNRLRPFQASIERASRKAS